MEIEIRLRQLLRDAGMDTRGRIGEIAEHLGVHRHTIRKLYHNQAKQVPLDTLGRLCSWLADRRVASEGRLPGALFGARPSALFEAVADARETIAYIGEYLAPSFPRSWVARDDAYAAWRLYQALSRLRRPAVFSTVHVPTHVAADAALPRPPAHKQADRSRAVEIFDGLNARGDASGILIGSPRANNLVELFVADLFRRPPFEPDPKRRVPFYLQFEESKRVESCFGGSDGPGAHEAAGIYYRRGSRWRFVASGEDRGVGLVVVRRNPGEKRVAFAVLGLSSIATAAMGRILCAQPQDFWPEQRRRAGLEVGVYVCSFELSGYTPGHTSIEQLRVHRPKVMELDVTVPARRSPRGEPKLAGAARRRRAVASA